MNKQIDLKEVFWVSSFDLFATLSAFKGIYISVLKNSKSVCSYILHSFEIISLIITVL